MTTPKMVSKTFSRKKGELEIVEVVPEFDWEVFKGLPLAREFCRKQYEAALHELAVEIHLRKNGTSRNHLKSMRSVLARKHIAKDSDKLDWLNNRDWSRLKGQHRDPDAAQRTIRGYAMEMRAHGDAGHSSADQRGKMADLVALLAGPSDDILADWLFEKFTNADDDMISEL